MHEHNIPLPTESERETAIRCILDEGLPCRQGVFRELRAVITQVGLRPLFFGAGDCIALSLLIWALALIPMTVLMVSAEAPAPALFLFSPLLYGALSLLTLWKELQSGICAWTWTFRISARMTSALRMLCFGGCSVLACVPVTGLLWLFSGRAFSLGWMLSLSLASLFLYGMLALFCQRLPSLPGLLTAPVLWLLLGLIPFVWPLAAQWLLTIPAAVFCLLAAAALPAYLLELRCFCRRTVEGGVSYAVR